MWQAQHLEHFHRGPRKSGDKWWLWAPPRFAWRTRHLEHLRLVLRGRRSIWSTFIEVRGSPATSDDFGRCSFCVAGAALGAPQVRFAWQAQHLEHLKLVLRGRCSTWSTFRTTPSTLQHHTHTPSSRQHHLQDNTIFTTSTHFSSTQPHQHITIYATPFTQHHLLHNTIYTRSSDIGRCSIWSTAILSLCLIPADTPFAIVRCGLFGCPKTLLTCGVIRSYNCLFSSRHDIYWKVPETSSWR